MPLPAQPASTAVRAGRAITALLDQHIAAFQNADAAALEQLLREDAMLEAPPLRTWYADLKFCMPYMATHVLGSPGR